MYVEYVKQLAQEVDASKRDFFVDLLLNVQHLCMEEIHEVFNCVSRIVCLPKGHEYEFGEIFRSNRRELDFSHLGEVYSRKNIKGATREILKISKSMQWNWDYPYARIINWMCGFSYTIPEECFVKVLRLLLPHFPDAVYLNNCTDKELYQIGRRSNY